MKLKYQFEFVEMDGESVAVPVGGANTEFRSVLRVNETAADIIKLLGSDTDETAIVNEILKLYTGDRDDIRKCVLEYIDELRTLNLIEE